ncbi:hypothetical protein CL618_03770 [archaeon]|nr:hypothetical protein [archaeon]|tara:strand:+ start:2318 stop:2773 length:456 start_codon:yes stop_codon:yes gene_type:complete
MKKLLVLLVVLSLVSVGLVMADSQAIGGDVNSFVEFNLLDTDVDYGSVNPGATSDPQNNRIEVTENNNVDFSIDITLTEDTSTLFENLYFDLDGSSTYEEIEKLDEVLVLPITNQEGLFTETLTSVLKVPPGFAPVVDATGIITYTITGVI